MGEAVAGERVFYPTEYRTFSRKLAPTMNVIGGALGIAGGLGVWMRATKLTEGALAPSEVAVTMGHSSWQGLAIAALGALTLLSAVTWLLSLRILKVLPLLYSLGLAVLVGWQLPLIDRDAAALADQSRANLDFVAFHAGYGWGAWCMLAGAIVALLGSLTGVLRDLDVRKGYEA